MAGKAKIAGPALFGQSVSLVAAKLRLPVAPDHVTHRDVIDPAQTVLWIDVMIATIQAAIMFQRQRVAAGFRKDAKRGRLPHPHPDLRIKELNKDAAQIIAKPLIKHLTKELAVDAWGHAPFADRVARILIDLRRPRQAPCPDPFDNRDELDVVKRPTGWLWCIFQKILS